MTHNNRWHNAVMANYTGHNGPVTMDAVKEGIPDELAERLTGGEYGLVMSAVNNAYHRGKAKAGAELIDGDAVSVDDKLYPLTILRKLSWEDKTTISYVSCNHDGKSALAMRGGNNDYYRREADGRYVRIERIGAEHLSLQGQSIYWRNTDTTTAVSYDGRVVDTITGYV